MLKVNNTVRGKTLSEESQVSSQILLQSFSGEFGVINSSLLDGYTIPQTRAAEDPIVDDREEIEAAEKIEAQVGDVSNYVARASLLDDSYWRTIKVNSLQGTVCSYELINQDADSASNVYEI